MRRTALCLAVLMLGAGVLAAAAGFESPPTLKAADVEGPRAG